MSRDRSIRTRLTRCSWIVLAASLVSACAHQAGARGPREPAEVRAAIAEANAGLARALVRGDARAIAEVFTEDGEIVPPMQGGFVSGRPAIEAYQAKRLQARRYLDAVITTAQLGVSGDLAWETGTNKVTLQQGESAPVTVTGRYLTVWRRDPDGRWRIRAEVPVTDPVE
ncbi:MAG TPA: nuclear transport factor 2 family protein [Anaeromyxobacteraceae bacterium]|nr:nuclear transport factor 2 family protein [Anaeromyxobacteraceae bacterium]